MGCRTIEKTLLYAEKRNKKLLRELTFISYLLGINIKAPSFSKKFLKIITILLVLFSSFGLYGQYCFVARHIDSDRPFVEYADAILTAFEAIMSTVKLIYLQFVQEKLYALLKQMQTCQIIRELEIFNMDISCKSLLCKHIADILNSAWKLTRRQLAVYICINVTTGSLYFFGGLILNTYHQFVGTANATVKLPFPAIYPMWESKGFAFPYYELQFFAVSCETFICGMIAVCLDGTFVILTIHGMALLRILREIIRYSTYPSMDPKLRPIYLRFCIQHYQRTFQFYTDVKDFYSGITLILFSYSLIILGMVLFLASIGLETDLQLFVTMIFYTMAAGFEVLLYCFNAQMLTSESIKLQFAWYDCDWFDESIEFRELIKMMILRSNRMMLMEASGYVTMSLETFLSIMHTSGSYFLLLRNVS